MSKKGVNQLFSIILKEHSLDCKVDLKGKIVNDPYIEFNITNTSIRVYIDRANMNVYYKGNILHVITNCYTRGKRGQDILLTSEKQPLTDQTINMLKLAKLPVNDLRAGLFLEEFNSDLVSKFVNYIYDLIKKNGVELILEKK
jgi:hypothetical protein